MSTHTLEGQDLERLLARVPDELGPEATIVAANKVRSGGIAGFFSREGFEVVVEVDDLDDAGPNGGVADFEFPELPTDTPAAPFEAAALTPSVPKRRSRPSRDEDFAAVLGRMVRDAGEGDSLPVLQEVDPAPTLALTLDPVRRSRAVAAASFDRRTLDRVGLPQSLASVVAASTGDPTVALLHLMDRLPRPDALPRQQGSVIVVLGDRKAALEVAEYFAGEVGADTGDVLIATRGTRARIDDERRIDGAETALERRRSWRRRRRPTIVAVDATVGRKHTGWASALLDALEPTQVWGVVEANRKPEDIRDWAVRLGGLDALAVQGIDDTASPGSVLGVGIPVGLLEGEDATPLRWTSILTARLEEAA